MRTEQAHFDQVMRKADSIAVPMQFRSHVNAIVLALESGNHARAWASLCRSIGQAMYFEQVWGKVER